MSKNFKEYFIETIETHNVKQGNGAWMNINCPLCGDNRKRLGVITTETGGFRVSCFNGGCELQIKPIGWEPDGSISKKTRELFERLGGNWNDIPLTEKMVKRRGITLDNLLVKTIKPKWSFSPDKLPQGAIPLFSDLVPDKALDVAHYVISRSTSFYDMKVPWMWSPAYPDYAILPFMDNDKVIGYVGRNYDISNGKNRFIQKKPYNYLYGQFESRKSKGYLFITESAIDASLVHGCATMSPKISKVQVETIKSMNRTPIIIPDQTNDREYVSFLQTAKENKWLISVPKWDYKDIGEAIHDIGIFKTLKVIIGSANTKYLAAQMILKGRK